MKRKLLSVVAVAMTMAMTTTSAFAAAGTPRERGNGDVDGDGTALTAADLISMINGEGNEANEAANVNGKKDGGKISGNDVLVAYNTILQPKTIAEDLVFNVYTEGLVTEFDNDVLGKADLGANATVNAYGTSIVDRAVTATPTTTIKDAIDQLVSLAANTKTQGINDQLDKIFFHSNVKGEVYLRSENGWSMFCYALQPIIPMDAETAALCGKTPSTAEEIAAKQSRMDALNEVKAILVGEQTDPAAVNTTDLTAEQLIAAKDAMYKAIPADEITDAEIKAAAERILKITDTKYAITAEFNGNTETLSSDAVETSEFIKGLIAIKDYDHKTMADYRNAFGDKLVLSNGNISATFEVAVTANKVD